MGAELPAADEFLRFSHKKHSFQHSFLLKKNIPVPTVIAVTIIVSGNTKIFQQAMSKTRSWAKINGRSLQSLVISFDAFDRTTSDRWRNRGAEGALAPHLFSGGLEVVLIYAFISTIISLHECI